MVFIVFLFISAALFGWSATLTDVVAIFAKTAAWCALLIAVLFVLTPVSALLAVAVALIILGLAFKSLFIY